MPAHGPQPGHDPALGRGLADADGDVQGAGVGPGPVQRAQHRPSIHVLALLAGIIVEEAQQRLPRRPGGRGHRRADLPALDAGAHHHPLAAHGTSRLFLQP